MEDFCPCRSQLRGHCHPSADSIDRLRSFAIPRGEKTTTQRRESSRQCDRIVGPGSSDHSPPIGKSRVPSPLIRDSNQIASLFVYVFLMLKSAIQKCRFDISSH